MTISSMRYYSLRADWGVESDRADKLGSSQVLGHKTTPGQVIDRI